MKNIVKGLVAGHFLSKMKHRRALHSIGGVALALGRTKMVLGLGAAALAADYLRKRRARKAASIPSSQAAGYGEMGENW